MSVLQLHKEWRLIFFFGNPQKILVFLYVMLAFPSLFKNHDNRSHLCMCVDGPTKQKKLHPRGVNIQFCYITIVAQRSDTQSPAI